MDPNAEIFFEHDRWGRNLAWSAGFHVAVAGAIVLYAFVGPRTGGAGWGAGGGGDAMGVTLVTTIPLPANPVQTQNIVATESKGLTQSQPRAQEQTPDAIPILDKNAKNKRRMLFRSAKAVQLAALTELSAPAGRRAVLVSLAGVGISVHAMRGM